MVMVKWVDSATESGWIRKQVARTESGGVSKCCTVGILLKESPDELTIMQNVSDNQYGDFMTIPRCCVRSIYKLQVKK